MKHMTNTPTLPPDKSVPLGPALAVMGLVLVAGGTLIWHYFHQLHRPANAMRVLTPPPSNPRVAGGPVVADNAAKLDVARIAAEDDLPDGIHPGGAGDALFKAGDTYFRVLQANGLPSYHFGFFTLKEGEWEHGYLTQGVRRILAQEDFAKEIGITDDQRSKLGELPAAPPARWPQADRDRFVAQYQTWAAATGDDKAKAGAELLKSLGAYGDQKRAADQKIMTDRAARAKAILTEKQLAKINPIPKWNVKTTQPAAK